MKTILILVGKTTDKHFQAGITDYVERIGHYMPFELVTIPELKNTKSLTEEQQKTAEGELILKQLQASDTVVLLDEHGKEFRSIDFARWLEQKRNTARRLVFIIGGPYGFSPAVYARANEQLSLSKMTFSHQMIRLVFSERSIVPVPSSVANPIITNNFLFSTTNYTNFTNWLRLGRIAGDSN